MRTEPTQGLSPKIKSVWRVSGLIWTAILALCAVLPLAIVFARVGGRVWALLFGIAVAATVVFALLYCLILPPIRHARWHYGLSEDYLEISRGIFWRNHSMIPFVRVQNTDTKQGPIMRAFGLASVTVATAAGEHEIPGLPADEAAQLRDRAAELARLAREDV